MTAEDQGSTDGGMLTGGSDCRAYWQGFVERRANDTVVSAYAFGKAIETYAQLIRVGGERGVTILVSIVIGVLSLNILGFLVTKVFFSRELDKLSPYGELVNVHGRNIHVYSMGQGEETIVLLPGLGIPLPCADFGPLMRKLSKRHTVVCLEYFGVGFSDQTDIPRTNEHYTQEIRAALLSAGFPPPYVLMPHSASGIYCEYYASRYRDEVRAIVMLDTTSSAVKDTKVPKFVYQLSRVQQATGLPRIVNAFLVRRLLKEDNGYTKREIRDYGKFMNHSFNRTIVDQGARFYDNVIETMGMGFPSEVAVLKIVPTGTMKQAGEEYQVQHMNRLGDSARSVVMEGSHFVYQSNSTGICEATTDFLLSVENSG